MKILLRISCAVVLTGLVEAAPIPGLFNTGVDAAGALLGPSGAVDPHYRLTQSADPLFPGPDAVTLNPGFPVGPWLAEGPLSRWITPNRVSGNIEPGDYVFTTTFSLTGFDPTKAKITGRWSTDNTGVDIRLNGNSTFQTQGGFTTWTDFILETGFVAGLNTLEFVFNNAAPGINPGGLRVELTGTVEVPGESPSILTHPVSQKALEGDVVTFTASADGAPPLTLQWRRNNADVPGETTGTLTISGAASGNEGSYTLRASNAFGSADSNPAILVVAPPLPAGAGLFSTGVDDLGDALLPGVEDPHYFITTNPDNPGVPAAVVHDPNVFPIVAGPWLANTFFSQWISPRFDTAAAAAGLYIYQLTIDLTGLDPATAVIEGDWATDNPGLDIKVNGSSTGQTNGTQFTGLTHFRLNGPFIPGNNIIEFHVQNEGVGPTALRVENVRGGAKPGGPATQAPIILRQPLGGTVIAGDPVTFDVLASGIPTPTYQWRRNTTAIPGQTNPALSISSTTSNDEADYDVVITNPFGVATSNAVRLEVFERIPGLQNTGVDIGGAALLTDDARDPHYLLAVNGDSGAPEAWALVGLPSPPWVPNSATARWIGPRIGGTNALPADYDYRTHFDVRGFDPATVLVKGSWATDNLGPDLLLNGRATGLVNTVQFTALTEFTISSGFVAGLNRLDFLVNNAPPDENPTGLFVESLRAGGRRLPGTVPPPSIDIVKIDATHAEIIWPASATPPWQLFVSNDLVTWVLYPDPVSTAANLNRATVDLLDPRYFRLQSVLVPIP